MYAASDDLDFERAARLRDDLGAIEKALEKQAVVLGDGTDADVIALAEDPLEVAVQIFYVRGGRVRGQRGWVADRVDEGGTAELVEQFLLQLYAGGDEDDGVPREILVPALPPEHEVFEELLSERRGSRVRIRVPQRGDKRTLQETVARNAGQSLMMHKTKRGTDLTARNQALEEIQQALGARRGAVAHRVLRHLQPAGHRGRGQHGRLRGRPGPQERVPPLRDQGGRGTERRRLDARGDHPSVPAAARRAGEVHRDRTPSPARCWSTPRPAGPRKFAYAPGLVVVDGGPPQVAAAQAAMRELGVVDIPVCGLAKRLEEVWLPDQEDPVIFARTSEGLYLLQRVRDEAHRFAITHHRSRRSKSMVESLLDDVPGLGEVRRRTLVKHFGSLKKLRAAEVDEIAQVPGIGPRTAEAIKDAVERAGGQTGRQTVNTATGEIQED